MASLDDRVERLQAAGLTLYQSRAYVALQRLRVAKVTPLARVSGVPRNKLYGVLEELERLGLAQRANAEPLEYRFLPPHAFLERRTRVLADLRAEFTHETNGAGAN